MPKRISWRAATAVIVLLLTATLFISFFNQHPEVWRGLRDLPKTLLVGLVGLYLVFLGTLAQVNLAALRLCKKTIGVFESITLTMYSGVVNFFGPLQSGPAFRALYLKQKHGVKIADYTFASVLYYFFYGIISLGLLFSGILKWWLVPIVGFTCFLGYFAGRKHTKFNSIDLNAWPYMALATVAQIVVLLIIFSIELHAVDPSITLGQVAIYTGAANLALFVSITPGAIGFREAFLVFSQNLHHISNATIVAANTIDRTAYVTMLLICSIYLLLSHTGRHLKQYVDSD